MHIMPTIGVLDLAYHSAFITITSFKGYLA